MEGIGSVIDLGNVLICLTIVAVSLVTGALLAPPYDGEQSVDQLVNRIRRHRTILNASAAFLVAGVLEVGALYHWPSALLKQETAKAFDRIALGTALCGGVGFSLLLAGGHLPAVYVLRYRALTKVPTDLISPDQDEQRERWLKARGLDAISTHELARLATMISPLVAGGTGVALLNYVLTGSSAK
jgi:hypothetical protein